MSAQRLHFYDAATPGNIPSGVCAAVAINGSYAWPEDEIRRMSRVFRYSVEREASWARYARAIDIERGAGLPEDVVPFIIARRGHGYNDGTFYCDRADLDDVRERLTHAGLPALEWVATLDGTTEIPGAWAVQYQGGGNAPYDLSVLYGVDNLHPPR